MCLISLQLSQHASYKLMLVANRDEQYDRPSLPAHFWPEHPDLLAGKDLSEHGTWLGITKQGKIAAVTNSYLTTDQESDKKLSRGNLVMDYLTGSIGPDEYLEQVRQQRTDYNGFNLIVGSSDSLHHYNNILDEIRVIEAGNHAVSNATLDTPWPKVTLTKAAMAELASSSPLDEEAIFRIMADRTPPPDDQLPDLPLPLPIKRAVSANFIQTERYGTRSTTLILIDHSDQVTFVERSYLPDGTSSDVRFSFQLVAEEK
ncbi:NRDE family protein [uncultured Trichococcus sp.]|uniref:NRDE family protein n=1 Tax=uncultured Trichococcus sp. TaxID=189665 RepID=UPI002A18B025|nr:NRDE family protein [uncultured Trichococcus sp.]